jgi:protein gp37
MGQHSAIEWTDHTFNPWWGCVKVSPGCSHCYAETWARRYGHDIWGSNKPRRFFGEKHWHQPILWNKQAIFSNRRARVFCASMADVFEDNPVLSETRHQLWAIISQTTMLDWLLLTKRPENIMSLVPWKNQWPSNIWAMVTVENQYYANKRIPLLLDVPANVRGLSIEPLLGPVKLDKYINDVQWVIVGGESGVNSRPMNPEWIRDIRDLCNQANVPFFFKQWGNWIPSSSEDNGISMKVKSRSGKSEILSMRRVSKKMAGQVIDGVTWKQVPKMP